MTNLDTLYLIHHSHTDIGYTHDQPVVWEMERRFIDAAIDACEQHLDHDGDHAFRWNVETVAPLLHWFQHSTDHQIERFLRLERLKRIDVMAMFVNITPLADTAELIEMFQPLRMLRKDYGLTIRSGMNCDVNGQNWGLVDILLDAGIEGFAMAINQHAGGAPLRRPNVFWWQAPSGRKLLTFNNWHYMTGNELQIGQDIKRFREHFLPFMLEKLDDAAWPLPVMAIQLTHPFGDNGSADFHLSDFVKEWNTSGAAPCLRLSTYSEWWDAVRPHADQLPTYRGDWTDYWNFGSISSAREAAMNRASRARLLAADRSFAMLVPLGVRPESSANGATPNGAEELPGRNPANVLATTPALREEAWKALYLWDEHTWGADESIRQPESEDSAAQWNHKAQCVYRARSLSLMLQRDGVAELSLLVPRAQDDALILFNPLPWSRRMTGPISDKIVRPRGTGLDPSASRHHQDRMFRTRRWWVPDVEVPPDGYTVVRRDQLIEEQTVGADVFSHLGRSSQPYSEHAVVENEFHRLTFDRKRGGLASWFDKRLQRELIDPDSDWSFGGVVYERVADMQHPVARRLLYDQVTTVSHKRGWKPDWWAERRGTERLLSHRVYTVPTGVEIVQTAELVGVASPVTYRIFLPNAEPWVELRAEWLMGLGAHPDATYITMPFAVPDPVARLDIGGQAIQPETDQIPGSCRDYFTVQNWIDFSCGDWGVTVACPDNPMVQFDDFHFGHDQSQFVLKRAMLLGWVTNNYWETNFRAYQPGQVTARYVVLPHAGGFDEDQAHRFGMAMSTPIVAQSAFEPARSGATLPREGSLLALPQPPIITLQVLPGWAQGDSADQAMFVRLLNASNEPQTAVMGSALLRITAAHHCDLFGTPVNVLRVSAGSVHMEMEPRRVAVLRLEVNRPG
jgi:alpha-mannosidase